MTKKLSEKLINARMEQFFNSAEGYMMLNMFEDALSEVEEILSLEPENFRGLYYKGLLKLHLQNFELAEQVFTRLMTIRPEMADIYVHLAYIYRRTKGLDDAIDIIKNALAINPNMALANYNLSCYYSLKSQVAKALRYLKRAIESDKKFAEVARTDEDFDTIRDDSRFRQLLK